MRNLYSIYLFLLFFLISCNETNRKIENDIQKPNSFKKNESVFKNGIEKFISDSNFYHWTAKPSKFESSITFHQEYAIYWYHGQCQYYYFTQKISDSAIELLWSYKSDCKFSMDFLENSNGIENFPKRGDLFATYSLKNDSTIQAKYNFPEWIKKVNEMKKDSIFPTFLYLEK